jgi:hypothetical protein
MDYCERADTHTLHIICHFFQIALPTVPQCPRARSNHQSSSSVSVSVLIQSWSLELCVLTKHDNIVDQIFARRPLPFPTLHDLLSFFLYASVMHIEAGDTDQGPFFILLHPFLFLHYTLFICLSSITTSPQ